MTASDDARLEAQLREAGSAARWPATPDLRAAVVARIVGEAAAPLPAAPPATPVPAPPARPSRSPGLRLVRALAVALLVLLGLAGVAVALGFRLPGLDIVFVERVPASPAGAGLALGSPVPLTEAAAFDRPRVLVPAALPAPDLAYATGGGDRRIVTLAYRAAGGQPTLAGSDLSLTVMAVPGATDSTLVRKLLGTASTIEAVTIGGAGGWWIAGAPHEVLMFRPDGGVEVLASALAGDTLVFARDGTLYRLESALGRDATIAIAESMH